MLPVSKSLEDIEAELARFRKRHKAGANKKLAEAKKVRTAMLREEIGHGKVRRKGCLASKPRPQPAFELPAPNPDRLACVSVPAPVLPLFEKAA